MDPRATRLDTGGADAEWRPDPQFGLIVRAGWRHAAARPLGARDRRNTCARVAIASDTTTDRRPTLDALVEPAWWR